MHRKILLIIISFLIATSALAEAKGPPPPANLTVTPDTWTNSNLFSIDWIEPAGVKTYWFYWKLDSVPTGPTDGTYYINKPFYLSATREGSQPIYLWLEDEAGNINQDNRSSGMLYYDGTPPGNPVSCTELGGAKDNIWQKGVSNPGFTWSGAKDEHSGVAGYYYYWGQDPNGIAENYTTKSEYDPPAVRSGTYYLRIKTRDKAGNETSWATIFTFKFDGAPPENPTTCVEPGGAQNNIWQKGVNSPGFTWSGAKDEHSGVAGYYYYWGQDPNGTSESYTTESKYDSPVVQSGTYYLRIKTKDKAGNETSWATIFTFKFDETPPENPLFCIEPSGAQDNIWQKDISDPNFGWSGADDAHCGVHGYYYYFGQDPNGTSKDYTIKSGYNPQAVRSGTYYLRIKTKDKAGNETSWATIFTFKFDDEAPTITIDYPLSNYWYKEPVTNYYGKASDVVSGIDLSTLEYNYNNQGWKQFSDDAGPHDWDDSNEILQTKEGATLQIRIKDKAGNLATSPITTLKIDLEILPPQNLVCPTHPDPGKWYSNGNLQFSWQTPADRSGIEGYSYLLDQTEGTIPDETIDTTNDSISFKGKEDGVWYFHLRARDKAGNWSETAHLKIQIDTTPPEVVTIDYPASNKWHKENITKYYGQLGDSKSGIDLSTLEYSYNGGPWTKFSSDSNLPGWNDQDEIPHTFQTEGATLQIRAKDKAIPQNLGQSEVTLIRVDTEVPETPVVRSPTHPDEKAWSFDNQLLIRWTGKDEISGIDGYSYLLNQQKDNIPDEIEDCPADTISLEVSLSDGIHYFHLRAKDKAGNWGEPAHYQVKIDTSSPPSPKITSSHLEDKWANKNSPAFNWTASDISGITGYSFILDQTAITTTDDISEGTGTTNAYSSLTDGIYYFHVKAKNGAGIWGETSHYKIKIDTTPPENLTIDYPLSNYWYKEPVTNYYGKASDVVSGIDLSTLEYNYNNQGWKQFSDDAGPHDWDDSNEILQTKEGATLQIRIKDKAGNLATSQITTLKVDLEILPPQNLVCPTHPDPSKWYSNGNLQFSWQTPADRSGIEGYSYLLDQTEGTIPDETIDTTNDSISFKGKEDGAWYFHLRARDKAGNWSKTAHLKVQIDTSPPEVVTIDYPASNKWHKENITKYYGQLGDSKSGIDLSTLEYSYNGSPWTKFGSDSNLPGWNDQDEIPHTFQTEGATLQIRVKDKAIPQNLGQSGVTLIRVQGSQTDTASLAQLVLDEGEFTQDRKRLSASWSKMSGVEEYQYSLGTTPGGRDIIDWTSVGQATEVEVTGLDLKEGETYYFAVQARKKKLLVLKSFLDLGISDGITLDSKAPAQPLVVDGGEQTLNSKELHFRWSSSDETSRIRDYLYGLGTAPESTDILNWRFGGSGQELLLTDLSLESGKTYYLSVMAIDKAGNESVVGVSDGIRIPDATPPTVVVVTDEGKWTTNNNQLKFSFRAEDEESEIEEYQYAIGTSVGSDDLLSFRPTVRAEITETGLKLANGNTYYMTVKVKSKAGLWSEPRGSDGITVDITSPSIPLITDDGETTKDTTSLHAAWSCQDDESGIVEYRYGLGTTAGGTDLLGWTSSLDTEIRVTNLNLSPDQSYYVSVKAKNGAGLWSEAGTSDGITVEAPPAKGVEKEAETAPTPLAKEAPKEEFTSLGKGGLEMTVGVYEDPDYIRLYVQLKNGGDKTIYAGLSDFILLTKGGKTLRPDISSTYIIKNHFSSKPVAPGSQAEGFIIFETKDAPKSLTYRASFGNEVLVEFP